MRSSGPTADTRPWEPFTAGSVDSSSKAFTVDGDIAHILPSDGSVTEMTLAPKLTCAVPGSFLSPTKRMLAADTWFSVEPDSSSTNTLPAFCRTSNVVLAGVTAPSSTRDG